MKVFLMHKRGHLDRFNNAINLLYHCDFIDSIEIVMNETEQINFPSIEEKNEIVRSFHSEVRDLRLSEKSLFYKSFYTMKKISEGTSPCIILEDDVLFKPEDLKNFVFKIKDIPKDWDCVFFGTGCNLKLEGSGFVLNENQSSRCTDSILITPSAAKRLYEEWKTLGGIIALDWDMSYRFKKLNMNIYWYEPGFVYQGSQVGKYRSLIQEVNANFFG